MTERMTPADHALLSRLLKAEQEHRAERVRYADWPALVEAGLIGSGPFGFAYLTHSGRDVAQGGRLDSIHKPVVAAPLTDAERAEMIDRMPKRMAERIRKVRE